MTPVPKENYKLGVPRKGKLKEIFNSDLKKYFGSDQYKNKMKTTKAEAWHFRDQSVHIDIPPLGMVAFKYENQNASKGKAELEIMAKVKSTQKSRSVKKVKPKSK